MTPTTPKTKPILFLVIHKQPRDRILIKINGRGCESNVGRVGGQQLLNLGKGCHTFDNMVHELGHSLGLLHTMKTRSGGFHNWD
ncbi:hypothetical protein ANCCAN_06391 [Ancylostoma caninum]|uniref:Peptidase M12A domain-containing protein n=1 Tax=Ancylostoma caninum TaxID=29170 RepID=A0A368GT55_ANCCA|nr:hypothetical protein ANCCAN_06391 [Ancylostoma caninum]